jgi:SAGA-associated factor 73
VLSVNCAVLKKNADPLKKRKGSPLPADPAHPNKKAKPTPKVTKGRLKGPVDLDKQCGVINDKGLPCSRSLTCKSHSMGAKRSVQGRSKAYDELLLDWQRANNPNFVERVKRESKAEKKEKKEKEKAEKKKLAEAAALLDPSAKKQAGSVPKKKKKDHSAAKDAVRSSDPTQDYDGEDYNAIDSEAEVDDLVHAIRTGRQKGMIAVPLAVPCDAGSMFVQSREKARVCRDLLMASLSSSGGMAISRTIR